MEQSNFKPKLQLSGLDGNGFFILGRCMKIMKQCGAFTQEEIKNFKSKAISGDYDHLLRTVMDHFDCE